MRSNLLRYLLKIREYLIELFTLDKILIELFFLSHRFLIQIQREPIGTNEYCYFSLDMNTVESTPENYNYYPSFIGRMTSYHFPFLMTLEYI